MSSDAAVAAAATVSHDQEILIEAIKKIGTKNDKNQFQALFGEIFTETEHTLEALNGTLRAAKKAGIISFEKQMLLKGADDGAVITLLLPVDSP